MSTSRSDHYDAIVIGAGQGGVPLAKALAEAGMRTALAERRLVGGTCVNYGCTPTKTMIASARAFHLARRGNDFGFDASGVTIDLPKVVARKDDIVTSFRDGNETGIEKTEGLELVRGEARFVGPRQLDVRTSDGATRRIDAERIVIDTGLSPTIPPLDGLEDVPYLTSTSILDLEVVPEHLIVLGGGYVAVEFAQMFRRFGSRVTVVQRGKQLLTREDADVADGLREVLEDDGVQVLLEREAVAVRGTEGDVRVTLDDGRELAGSHVLVAVGRKPNTEALDPAAAGIELDDRGFVRTDDRLRTNVEGVYAIGDVRGGPAFTHISYDDFRILKANLLEDADRTTDGRLVPYTVFTDPQLGRVGMSESQAREAGHRVRVAKMPMEQAARALEAGETRGFMKATVDAGTGAILGCAILGREGGELMGALQIAMMGGLTFDRLRDAPFAHPTLVESLNNLFSTLE